MTHVAVRRAGTIAATAAIVLALLGVPAQAVEYRYWSYWWGAGGGWTLAPAGAAHAVKDGDVEGWRFGVGGVGSAPQPRAAASFSGICGGTPPAEGQVRVALVVDYGTAGDAPPGQGSPARVDTMCAVVPASNATGFSVLGQYGGVRQDRGLICAINGYPAGECAAAVEPPPPQPQPEPEAQPPPQPEPNPPPPPPAQPQPEAQPEPPSQPAPVPAQGSSSSPSGSGSSGTASSGSAPSSGSSGVASRTDPATTSAGSGSGWGSADGSEPSEPAGADDAAATDTSSDDPVPTADAAPEATPTPNAARAADGGDTSADEEPPAPSPSASPTATDEAVPLAAGSGSSSGPWVTVGVLVVAAALGGTAWWRSRARAAS